MNISLARPLPKGVGYVTQRFGARPNVYLPLGLAGHEGADYGTEVGTPVLAMHPGKCWIVSGDRFYGNYVRICGEDFETVYAHLSEILVEDGQEVETGYTIALSGNTGNSENPHLHIGLKINGMQNPPFHNYIDPLPFRDN